VNKRIALIGIVALVLMFSFSQNAFSKGSCGKKSSHCKSSKSKSACKAYFYIKNSDELGLKDEQIDKLKALGFAAKKDLIKRKAEIEVIAIDIMALKHADTVDLAAINKLIDKKYDLKKEKAKAMVASEVQIKNVLTDSQKEKVKDLWKQCKLSSKRSE